MPPPCRPPRNHAISGADLGQWYRWGQEQGQHHGVPQRELDWFIEAVTDVDRLAVRLGTLGDRPLIQSQFDLATLTQCWEQRCRDRTPVQYLAGHTPWRRFILRVSPAVLIPRPETELLVDLIAQKLHEEVGPLDSPDAPLTIADLGTGSGAIALALATLLPPSAQIYGVDCSADAIAIAPP
ncbi:MAG: methyltransferase domain-containing protein, partial [Cyanobacteria bacterium P01_H01_bin.130]